MRAPQHGSAGSTANSCAEEGVCSCCRTRFWWDLAAWIPFDYIVLLIMGDFHTGSSIVARVPLLRLLRMVRLPSLKPPDHQPSVHLSRQVFVEVLGGKCSKEHVPSPLP